MPPKPPDHWAEVIGAASVILGVLIASGMSMLSAWRERKHRRAAVMLQKLEEFTIADRAAVAWFAEFQGCEGLPQAVATPPTERCHRLESLALLYFPRLRPVVAAYSAELRSFYSFGLRCAGDGPYGAVGARMLMLEEPTYRDHDRKIQQLRKELSAAIELEARAHLQKS